MSGSVERDIAADLEAAWMYEYVLFVEGAIRDFLLLLLVEHVHPLSRLGGGL